MEDDRRTLSDDERAHRAFWRFMAMCFALALIAVFLVGCGDSRVLGRVNGQAVEITAPPTGVERPHLRDNVRKDDIVCGEEPPAKFATQKQANQSIQNRFTWGRECKRKAEIGWELISKEP